MLVDAFGRHITYMRVSITDKCNFRCRYCVPEQKLPLKSYQEILRYEEIAQIVSVAAELGIQKIRLTGGEPLVRKNVEHLIWLISQIKGIQEICMTTNGSWLTEEKAIHLKKAGLTRVNISLDTLDAERFKALTGQGKIEAVLSGIRAAVCAGLTPVKVNMVVMPTTTPADIEEMSRFCQRQGVCLQTIRQFHLCFRSDHSQTATDRPSSCESCNRIRLTADGFLKSCLFSDREIKVDLNQIRKSLLWAVASKPQKGTACQERQMHQIGG